jgi:hypothetical protein
MFIDASSDVRYLNTKGSGTFCIPLPELHIRQDSLRENVLNSQPVVFATFKDADGDSKLPQCEQILATKWSEHAWSLS